MPEHIKMPAIVPLVRYVADGVRTAFAYSFPIFASEDLSVYIDGARQISSFTIDGAGETAGGYVTFDTPPAEGAVVTLERFLSIERISDFIQGGDFSAQSINNELDYLVAALQQVARENDAMLRYDDHEAPAQVVLPHKAVRAGKALGFDMDGHPVAVSLDGAMAAPDYTVSGAGGALRSMHHKFSDCISVKDFGALGDGLNDDTLAFQQALSAHQAIFVPAGSYLITDTITLREGQSLHGVGAASRLKCASNSFTALMLVGGFISVQSLAIDGGLNGVLLRGQDSACVQNALVDVQIIGAQNGLVLDGYKDASKPCYWNSFTRILVEQPTVNGVHLMRSGAGDTPNANRFYGVRVFSKGALTSGSGFYVEEGALNNAFVDCESNVNGASAQSCFRVGGGASNVMIVNLLCESNNLVSNLKLDAGSQDTFVMNLTATSDGAAIEDLSGGAYNAVNAGYPEKNTLRKTSITDLTAGLMRYETRYIDTAGSHDLDLSVSVNIVNAINGAITVNLPQAALENNGAVMTVKKVDQSDHIVTLDENGGDGADGIAVLLGEHNDYVTVISNGAAWYVIASNRAPGSTRYIDASGTVDIDMAVDTYLVSSYNGALITRLPPANAAEAIGRVITLKKTDPSSNAVTVTEQGGAGPDLSSQVLATQFDAITVVSNGAQWYVLSRYP